MADPNTRTGKRTPVTLKIKFKSETLEQFIERYAVDVSQGGIFIRTKEPLAVGTQMRFEFQLRDASPLIGGEGTVVWTRENDPSRPAIAPGMGVRFDRLAEGSQGVLERILAEKAKQAPSRPVSDSIKPPLFTDTPTRVAPAPIQEQLLGAEKPHRRGEDYSDQHTPLPKPMPFHSDADEFPDEAFEEATKVRALDELVAQTAEPSAPPGASGGEQDAQPAQPAAAARSLDSLAASEAESAPGLPSPPEPEQPSATALGMGASATKPRLLDTTPSPRTEPAAAATPTAPAEPAVPGGPRTKIGLGLEAPRMHSPSAVPLAGASAGAGAGPSVGGPMSRGGARSGSSPPHAVAAEPTSPVRAGAPDTGGGASKVILLLVAVAAAAAAVWFFVLRDKATPEGPKGGGSDQLAVGSDTGTGSGPAVGSGPDVGSGGSNQAAVGSGSAKVETPKGPVAETVIDASVPKSRIEVVGTDQSGEAPFTAKLEKDKPYKVRISAPGYATLETDVIGGAPPTKAALVPKPRVISFKTDPAGVQIWIEGVNSNKSTPQEVELSKSQAAKKAIRIRLYKAGYKALEKTLQADAFTEDETKLIATVEEKLQVQAAIVRPPAGGSGSGTGAPTGGSAGSGEGGGSAAPPPPPPPGDGASGGAGSQGATPKEPEPSL